MQGIHPELDTEPAIAPRAAPRPIPLVIDARRLERAGASSAADSTATQAAYFARIDGLSYRLKLNPADRLTNTFHEVLSARLLNDIGLRFNPPSAWVADQGQIWVASQVIAGARDVGPYLMESAAVQARQPGPLGRKIATQLDQHRKLEAKVAEEMSRDEVRVLLERHRKGGFEQLSENEHQVLQPLRDAHRAMLQVQERIMDLLPQGEALRANLLMAAYAGEVVGEWDFLNHARFNTMVHENASGELRVQTVDRGVSGLVGFGGKLKQDGEQQANQPARINDPYARSEGAGRPYLPAHFTARDMDFARASPSFGLIGAIPRSASSAFIFRDVIRNEREHLQPDTTPGQGQDRIAAQGLPDEALQVAWLLKHRARPHQVRNSIDAACDECRRHPATNAMLQPSVMGAQDAAALADLYNRRIGAIVARAEQGDALNRWANAHQTEARRILMDKELTGPV